MPSILITGVSSGIGRASARLFADKGWDVIGTLRKLTGEEAAAWGDSISLERFDLAVPGDGEALADRVLGDRGCPDVLLNNAGMLQWGPIEEVSSELLERIYRVNVFGQLELARAFIPSMRERGSGQIANVTSLGGRMVFPFFAVYNSSKHAMEGLSEGLWHELKPFGIAVKAIEPGFVETPIYDKAMGTDRGGEVGSSSPYTPYMQHMVEFERSITSRTTSEEAAREVYDAVTDDSDRLRYPIAAYAKAILRARRALGDQYMMGFFHEKWMGPDSG